MITLMFLKIIVFFGEEVCDLYAWPYSFSFCSMKWVEVKMKQLGVLDNPNYKITAMLDHMAMITVQSDHYGVFDCKPLGLIWAHFPEVGFFYI